MSNKNILKSVSYMKMQIAERSRFVLKKDGIDDTNHSKQLGEDYLRNIGNIDERLDDPQTDCTKYILQIPVKPISAQDFKENFTHPQSYKSTSGSRSAIDNIITYLPEARESVIIRPQTKDKTRVEIISLEGTVMRDITIDPTKNKFQSIDVSDLRRGIYIIQATRNDNTYTGKLKII
jgi:hypothetical protein